jgi:hypothetical protein
VIPASRATVAATSSKRLPRQSAWYRTKPSNCTGPKSQRHHQKGATSTCRIFEEHQSSSPAHQEALDQRPHSPGVVRGSACRPTIQCLERGCSRLSRIRFQCDRCSYGRNGYGCGGSPEREPRHRFCKHRCLGKQRQSMPREFSSEGGADDFLDCLCCNSEIAAVFGGANAAQMGAIVTSQVDEGAAIDDAFCLTSPMMTVFIRRKALPAERRRDAWTQSLNVSESENPAGGPSSPSAVGGFKLNCRLHRPWFAEALPRAPTVDRACAGS